MFYSLVKRNSKRNRKENGLFFMSLIISIVAFYIILSLEKQDVIVFLKTMESDALDKLFLLIPGLYGISLFVLFFLVYFAGKYQLDRRSKELGMYLLLGMKRRKLILMLFAEELWNSLLSLLVGIPIAIFISEVISLVTAKVVGLGIIGHSFSFSIVGVIGTVIGYFSIRFLALIILSGRFFRREVVQLLSESQLEKKRKPNKVILSIKLIIGLGLVGYAFYLSIIGYSWNGNKQMLITLILGISGIFLLFQCIGILLEIIIKYCNKSFGLSVFTFRQLQESVFLKPSTLAIASLLLLMAFSLLGFGVSLGFVRGASEARVMDYTFEGSREDIYSALNKIDTKKYIGEVSEMKVGSLGEFSFNTDNIKEVVNSLDNSEGKDILVNNLQYFDAPYLISLDSYNNILKMQGKKPIVLRGNEVALYQDPDYGTFADINDVLSKALKKNTSIVIDNKEFKMANRFYSDSIVTDRFITISKGLIVSEEVFNKYTNPKNINMFWNVKLKDDFVKENGLMQSIAEVNNKLDTLDIRYESYLQNMGRSIFYNVAGGYTTIYLGVIFLIIANTLMGVQFLMHQQKTTRRYRSLTYIGGTYEMLKSSARKQISMYFSLPLVVGAICSIFAVRAMFTGISTDAMREQLGLLMERAIPVIILICMIELAYIYIVKVTSDRNILRVMDIKREDS